MLVRNVQAICHMSKPRSAFIVGKLVLGLVLAGRVGRCDPHDGRCLYAVTSDIAEIKIVLGKIKVGKNCRQKQKFKNYKKMRTRRQKDRETTFKRKKDIVQRADKFYPVIQLIQRTFSRQNQCRSSIWHSLNELYLATFTA